MALKINLDQAPEPVRSDSPTGRSRNAPAAEGRPLPQPKRARRASSASKKPASGQRPTADALSEALGAPQKPVASRMSLDLWAAAAATAQRIDVPLRLLLTDAVVRALELDDDEHLRRIRDTEKREKLAQIGER